MFRNSIFQILIGITIIGFGVILYSISYGELAEFIIGAGVVYGIAAFVLTLLGLKLPPPFPKEDFRFIENWKVEKQVVKTEERLLRSKRLFDAGILSQVEYNAQTVDLKNKLLKI